MKIILLYGPGEIQKRGQLLQLKKGFDPESIATVDLKVSPPSELENVIGARPLFFSGPRLVVAENCPEKLDLNLAASGGESTLIVVAGALKESSILLKSAKQLKAQISSFDNAREVSAFPFVDSLMEGKKEAFQELEKLREEYGWVYIFSMIYYGLRRNLLPLPASTFAQNKIKLQKMRFKESDWPRLYRQVLLTEYKIKSGLEEEKFGLDRLVHTFIGKS